MNLKDSTLKRRRSSVSGESHRDAYSGAAVNVSVSIEELPGNIDGNILVKSFRYLYHILYSKGTFSNYILPIMCVIGISIDPFFLFIPFVDDTKKCVGLDKRLGFTAGILRSLFDLFYLLYIARRTRRRFFLHLFSIDLLAILPLPQVRENAFTIYNEMKRIGKERLVISIVIPAKEGSKLLYTIRLLKLCVIFQFVPRFIAIYELVADKFDRATWARATFNLFLFILAGHVFGSFWYFFAIEREIECWKEACLSQTGCGQGSFYCGDILGDYRFLNGFCPTKTRDTTIYDFGIFYDALQSGVVEATDFPQKLHCFLWGLKTLRGVMVYLQSEVVRSATLRSLKVQELEKQMSFEKHSKDIQTQSKTESSEGVTLEEERQKQKEEQVEPKRHLQSEVVRSETLRSLKGQELEKQMSFEKHSKDIQKQSKTESSEGLTLEEERQKQKEEQVEPKRHLQSEVVRSETLRSPKVQESQRRRSPSKSGLKLKGQIGWHLLSTDRSK
ncbi:hypothetical protein Pint_18132 [Pistacia integerrima]|uniref:Uncharacterized protein n=1 Tax=Pistacia integerrima TaxID=434235 RepID=A0ACC0YYH3_9ROSI|nr:hypothetical protein Pint_18132 [Pistacia integerrima]